MESPCIFALQPRKFEEVEQDSPQWDSQERVQSQNSFVSKEKSALTSEGPLHLLCLAAGQEDRGDGHFPANKGPKSLQYSNSLNNTPLFIFYSRPQPCPQPCPRCPPIRAQLY